VVKIKLEANQRGSGPSNNDQSHIRLGKLIWNILRLMDALVTSWNNGELNIIRSWNGILMRAPVLYHQVEVFCTYQDATNICRLRSQVEAHACNFPTQYTPVVEVCERTIYTEVANKYIINETYMDVIEHVIEYISGIGDTFNTLPRHIQSLIVNIPELDVLNEMDVIVDQDIIVATDRSVVF
jgi:hypothetical protein